MMMLYRFSMTSHRWRRAAAGVLLIASISGAFCIYGLQFTPSHIVSRCSRAQYRMVCYTDSINAVMRHRGLSAAFDVLAAAYAADADFAASCHGNTHDLGNAAYEQYHRTGMIELTPKASYCAYGFYHGFMEALLAQTHDLDEARAFCAFAGRQVPVPAGYAEGACYHGIGHGVTDGSVPSEWGNAEAMAAPGLALCSQVAPTDEWRRRCYSGVFNSLALLYRDPKYKLDPRHDPFGICGLQAYDTLEKEACYGEMNTLVVFMGHRNLAASLAYTRFIADAHYRSLATRSAADFYVKLSASGSAHISVADLAMCQSLGAPFEDDCIGGLTDGIWEFGQPGRQYEQALALCGSNELPWDRSQACYAHIQESASMLYGPEIIPKICALVPDPFKVPPCTPDTHV